MGQIQFIERGLSIHPPDIAWQAGRESLLQRLRWVSLIGLIGGQRICDRRQALETGLCLTAHVRVAAGPQQKQRGKCRWG